MKEVLNPREPHPYCPHDCNDSGYVEAEGDWLPCPIHMQNDPDATRSALAQTVEDVETLYLGDPAARRPNYWAYLKSSEWKRKRRHMLDRADGCCQSCGKSRRLEVHHLSYQNLGYESPEELAVLCSECHKALHEELKARGEKIK